MARRRHDASGNPKAPVRSRGPARRGFSLLELQVAFIVFGIALTGLFPLVATYSKGIQSLERRVIPRSPCYLVPSTSPWARKLGASACLTTQAPGPRTSPPTLPVDDGDAGSAAADGVRLVPLQNEVRVVSLDRSLTSEEMTVRVEVNAEVPKP